MDNSVSVHLFISRKNGDQVSLEETEKLRALFNQICDERGYSLWQVASETAAQPLRAVDAAPVGVAEK